MKNYIQILNHSHWIHKSFSWLFSLKSYFYPYFYFIKGKISLSSVILFSSNSVILWYFSFGIKCLSLLFYSSIVLFSSVKKVANIQMYIYLRFAISKLFNIFTYFATVRTFLRSSKCFTYS